MKPMEREFQQSDIVFNNKVEMPVLRDDRGAFLNGLYALPGRDIVNRILDLDDPREFIQGLPCEDLYSLIKKIGDTDSVSLLELASKEQWQYVIDLEIWRRDRFDLSHCSHWMDLLQKANYRQLTKWLFSDSEYLAYYYFYRVLEVVVINNKDDIYGLPEGFFSLDGVFYIRVTDPEHRESIENIIRVMADEDFNKYQSLLQGLAGVLPAEVEEEMYWLRNVRLAEHGFLPYEEAIALYSPLEFHVLKTEKRQDSVNAFRDDEIKAMVPVLPLLQSGAQNLFFDVVAEVSDHVLVDRLRLEFAGLANQLMAADGLMVRELDVLVETCKKAARIINLTIEKVCGGDPASAEDLLRNHSLVTLFRVGFGMTLKLKWEAERWLKGSWFHRQGLNAGFWGEYWGGILEGILAKRPQYYIGLGERVEYRDFEWLSELSECLKVLRDVMVLDGLLEKLTELYQSKKIVDSPEITYRPFLFNPWGRLLLNLEPSFSGISLEQVRSLFSHLRERSSGPPYSIARFKKRFIKDFMSYVTSYDLEAATILEQTLAHIWEEFSEEYKGVSLDDMDERFSGFLTIVGSR